MQRISEVTRGIHPKDLLWIAAAEDERGGLKGLLNLDINEADVRPLLKEAGFTGYRFDGAFQWIMKTVAMIIDLN